MTDDHPTPDGHDEIPEGMFDDRDLTEDIYADGFYEVGPPLEAPTWPFWPDRNFDERGNLVIAHDERRPSFDELEIAGGALFLAAPRKRKPKG